MRRRIRMTKDRLVANAALNRQDFNDIAHHYGVIPTTYVKTGKPNAAIKRMKVAGTLTTYNETGVETVNTYQAGDYIVTRLDGCFVAMNANGQPNQYVVSGANIDAMREDASGKTMFWADEDLCGGRRVIAEFTDGSRTNFGTWAIGKNLVDAVFFEGGLDIVPPWGGRQTINGKAWLFYSHATGDVYGCDEGGMSLYHPVEN